MADSGRREKDLDLVEDFETVRAVTSDGRSVQVPKSKFGGNLEIASANVLGGIKASAKSESETQEVKIDPNTGKLYCPPSEVSIATADKLGGIVAEVKTSEETEEVKIDPSTGKLYVKNSNGNGESSGGVTGVKGKAETTYRTGNVNITPENIGLENVDNTSDAEKSVNYATFSGSATKASQDEDGNVIISTYAKKTELAEVESVVNDVSSLASNAADSSTSAVTIANEAKSIANTAKEAVATIEGLANVTTAQEVLAAQIVQIEENKTNIKSYSGLIKKNGMSADSVSNTTRMLNKMEGEMGAITYDNKWSRVADGSVRHIVIPVIEGDDVYIASSETTTNIAFVKSYKTPVAGELLEMSLYDGFTNRITTTVSGSNYKVPEDVKYLIVVIYSEGTSFSFTEFSINGISLLKDNMKFMIEELESVSSISKPLVRKFFLKDVEWVQGYYVESQPEKPASSSVRVSANSYIPVMKGITYTIVNAEDYNIHVTFYNENKEFQSNPIYFTATYAYTPTSDGYIRIGVQYIDGSTILPSDMESTEIYILNGFYETVIKNKSDISSISNALGLENITVDMNEDYYLDNRYIIAETGKIVSYDSSTYRIKKVDVNKGDLIEVRAYAGGAVSIISIDLGGDEYLSVVPAVAYKTTDYVYIAEKNCTIAVSFKKGESNLLYITRLSNINGGNSNEDSSVNLSDKIVINDQEYLNIAYSSIGLAPINTAEHYIMAAHCGFNAAKADIEITSDNVLVCCHDTGFTFDADGRITTYNSSNATLIHDMTWEAVSKLEYAAKPALLGYYAKVCTIDKYLRICKENGLIPFITVRSVNTDLVLEQLFPMIRKYFLESVAIINLFPPSMEKVQKVRAYSKTIKICYTQNYGGDLSATLIANVAANKPAYIAIESNRVSNDTNMSLIPTANEYGIRCISYDTTELYYRDMQLRGITGFAITRPILPYKPKRITFQLSLDNAGDTLVFRNRESNLLTADVSIDKSAMIVTIKNIRKKYSDYGFVDGLMPALMNMLPYNINVVSRSRKDRAIEAYWEDDSIKLAIKSLNADLFEFSVDV